MKNIINVVVLVLTAFQCLSQNIVVSGIVTDSISGERLIGANIFSPNVYDGTATNSFGHFVFQTKTSDSLLLEISYIGYKKKQFVLQNAGDTSIAIQMIRGKTIQQVSVYGNKPREARNEISKITITPLKLNKIPNITGEPDMLKTLQLMPGIAQGTEGSNGLFIRGGTPDQNLFLLDDVPLYNVSHLGGIFSVFAPELLKRVDLYKGGFPARYGGRVSAIVDVRNKDGNLSSLGGEIGLSLLLSKFFLEGPIINNKASFIFSVRRSNVDLYTTLYNKVLSNSPNNSGFYFYDINAKINYILNAKNRLFLSFYNGLDKFYNNEKQEDPSLDYTYEGNSSIQWGNYSGSLKWQHIFNNQISNNLTLAYTRYNYSNLNNYSMNSLTNETSQVEFYEMSSTINDFIIKSDFQIPINNTELRTGFDVSYHQFEPSAIQYRYSLGDSLVQKPNLSTAINATNAAVYTEYSFRLSPRISSNVGFRANVFNVSDTSFLSLEPRIVVNYQFIDGWALKGSYSKMSQNLHLLTNSNTGLPTDLWVPSTKEIHPEKSSQIVVGVTHTSIGGFEYSVEGYYKNLENLIEYKEGVLVYSPQLSWTEKVEREGEGYAKGVEIMVEKTLGRFSGWIGYTLSETNRKFTAINNGRYYPFKYDQTHNLNIVSNYVIKDNLSFSCSWTYHTGNTLTLAEGKYGLTTENFYNKGERKEDEIHVYSNKNAFRMPAYHRLDFGLTYTKQKTKGLATWNVGVFNAYNRQNAYYLFFKQNDGQTKLYQQSILPIMINFGYSFKFGYRVDA